MYSLCAYENSPMSMNKYHKIFEKDFTNTDYYLRDFINSVFDLADKLPQWSSDEFERIRISSVSSLTEELGEVSGLVSKYRVRKNWGVKDYKSALSLVDFNKIKGKFIDETSDFLWVAICSFYSLMKHDKNYKEDIFNFVFNSFNHVAIEGDKLLRGDSTYDYGDLYDSLYQLIRWVDTISIALSNIKNSSFRNDNDTLENNYKNLITSYYHLFRYIVRFVNNLENDYHITLLDLMYFNMKKLCDRYDTDGKRVDGK